jgi:hypothetical protein
MRPWSYALRSTAGQLFAQLHEASFGWAHADEKLTAFLELESHLAVKGMAF